MRRPGYVCSLCPDLLWTFCLFQNVLTPQHSVAQQPEQLDVEALAQH